MWETTEKEDMKREQKIKTRKANPYMKFCSNLW